MFANGARAAEPDHALAVATAAEALGFDSLWAVQHVAIPAANQSPYPFSDNGTVPGGASVAVPDPLVWLAWVGAATTTIRLATDVLILPQQHPLVVAKQVATLDRLTGGRVILGVGAGWLRDEFDALGAGFDRRGARMDEAIAVLRQAWAPGASDHYGDEIRFDSVHIEPKPASTIPIVVGGHSAAAARRAGRLADGFFPLECQGDHLRRLAVIMRQAADEAGRDPDRVEITVDAPSDAAEADAQAEVGVARVVVNAPDVPTAAVYDALAQRLADTMTWPQ
jgi:probable F420-dependent oxidoreductase